MHFYGKTNKCNQTAQLQKSGFDDVIEGDFQGGKYV